MGSEKTKHNTLKTTGDVLAPGKVLPTTTSTALRVGKGSLCRIRVASQTYVAFGKADMGAVSSSTDPGLELNDAGVYLVMASDDFIRTSADVARLEIL